MPRPPPTRRGPTSAARGRIRCEAMPPGRPQRCRAKLRRAHFGVSSPILNCLVIAAPLAWTTPHPFHYQDLHGDRTHDRPGAVCIASISSQLRLMPPGLQTSLAVVHPHRQRAPHTRGYSNSAPPRPEGLTTVDVPTKHMHMPGDAHKRIVRNKAGTQLEDCSRMLVHALSWEPQSHRGRRHTSPTSQCQRPGPQRQPPALRAHAGSKAAADSLPPA